MNPERGMMEVNSMIRCYITDRRSLLAGDSLLQVIERNLLEGPDWIQIREKDLSARDVYELVRAALALSNPRGVEILVNGRVDVALAAGASGVHLPANSPPPFFWRRIAPAGFLFGVSCHSVAEVQQAAHEDADYALFGPVFSPISKTIAPTPLGLDDLARSAGCVRIPVLALGGITTENAASCIDTGAAGVAGISLFQRR